MGIPSYFSYIKKRYDSTRIIHNAPTGDIENLFLDLNGIIHPCCQSVLKVFEEGFDGKGKCPSKKEIEDAIYEKTINYIVEMVDEINPKNVLYIGIDGVAPRAKMFQQRKRRFKSHQDKRCDPELKNKKVLWDTNGITPGTEFMYGLNLALKNSIKLNNLKKKIQIILSDSQVPSEGEHKIVQYIKKNKPSGTCVIHGLDADLIMLSMLCYPQNIYLFRHDNEKKFYFHINTFVFFLKMHFDSLLKENVCETRIIDEYTFLCFFMGNDFLPHHYGLEISDEGIDFIIEKYCTVKNKKKNYFATLENGDLNTEFLCEFLQILCQSENDMVEKRMERTVYKNVFRHGNKPADLFKFWPDYHRTIEKYIKFGSPHWMSRYYTTIHSQLTEKPEKNEKTKQIENKIPPDFINNMVVYYLQGLVWNFQYYKNRCVSQTWFYPYLHAPCLTDISAYLSQNFQNKGDINELLKRNQHEYSCFQQLLFVLPPKSFDLLPKSWKDKIMANKHSKEMFPDEFELDPIGSIFRWQCPPILPYFHDTTYLNLVKNCSLAQDEIARQSHHQEYSM